MNIAGDPNTPLTPWTPSLLKGVRVECSKGHVRVLEPIGFNDAGECSWSTGKDSCQECGEEIACVGIVVIPARARRPKTVTKKKRKTR